MAQVARARDAGLTPSHLDSHQHVHLHPALLPVVARVARRFGIGAVRASRRMESARSLRSALLACADLALDPEVVALQRMVLQESAAFPELAANFYKNGISRTVTALAGWLRAQVRKKRIALDDVEEAAGMLIGMVASAPQRAAIYGGVALPSRKDIERRVKICAALFLNGCRAA